MFVALFGLLAASLALAVPSSAAPSSQAKRATRTPTPTPVPFQPYVYTLPSAKTSYDIMLVDSSGPKKVERRVTRVKVDSTVLSDISARLSPDGTYVAYRISGNQTALAQLFVAEVKTGKGAAVPMPANSGDGLGTYLWSHDSSMLAFVVAPEARSEANADESYGTIYIAFGGLEARPLPGSGPRDRLLAFSDDGQGVYASRLEEVGGEWLQHLVYIPISGMHGRILVRSRPGLRYSNFTVWAAPGGPSKVAYAVEGDFGPPPADPVANTGAPLAATPAESPTLKREPYGGSLSILGASTRRSEIVAALSVTATMQVSGTVVAPARSPAPVQSFARPNALGVIVSDVAGTWPLMLLRDAEDYPYFSWSSDGKSLVLGGGKSGKSWVVDMASNRRPVTASLLGLTDLAWSLDGTQAVLADTPNSRLVTVNFASGTVADTRNLKASPTQPGASVVKLSVPYIHQVNDVAAVADGNWACGPTSVAMVLAFYNRLVPWSVYSAAQAEDVSANMVSSPSDKPEQRFGSDYAAYVVNEYTYNGYTYSATAPDPRGKRVGGLYGTISPTGLASWYLMTNVLSQHDLGTQYIPVNLESVKAALQRGHPVILGTELTPEGHILVAVGYTANGFLIMNDPYGNRFAPGYGRNNGEGVLYQWDATTAWTALEVIGERTAPAGYPRTSRPRRTATPTITTTPAATLIPTFTPGAGPPLSTPTTIVIAPPAPVIESVYTPTPTQVVVEVELPVAVPTVTPFIPEPTPTEVPSSLPTLVPFPTSTPVPVPPTPTATPVLEPTAIPTMEQPPTLPPFPTNTPLVLPTFPPAPEPTPTPINPPKGP